MELYVESIFFRVVMLNIYANEYHLATNLNSSLNKIFIAEEKNFQFCVKVFNTAWDYRSN